MHLNPGTVHGTYMVSANWMFIVHSSVTVLYRLIRHEVIHD